MKNLIIHHHIFLHPLILIIVGLIVRYAIGRRRLNRRGITGLQLFSSMKNGGSPPAWKRLLTFWRC